MTDDARHSDPRPQDDTPRPTGEAPHKPAAGGVTIGVRLAIGLAVIIAVGVGIVLLATAAGGGGNGQTTGMAPLVWTAAVG